jgi:hypothetical protein
MTRPLIAIYRASTPPQPRGDDTRHANLTLSFRLIKFSCLKYQIPP